MRDFWLTRGKIGDELLQHKIKYDYVGRLAHAEYLVLIKSYSEAIPLLLAERAELEALNPADEKNMKDRLALEDKKENDLRVVSRLLFTAGDEQGAGEAAELYFKTLRNSYLQGLFTSPAEVSKVYREAGQRERALEILNRRKNYVKDESETRCEGNSYRGIREKCARELVYLGMPELTYKKGFSHCWRLWPRKECRYTFEVLYKAAIEAKQPVPDKVKYFPTIDSQSIPRLLVELVYFHFNRGEYVLGAPFLREAIPLALDEDYEGDAHCWIAELAYSVDEKDMVDDLFRAFISSVAKKYPKLENRLSHYRHGVECFLKLQE